MIKMPKIKIKAKSDIKIGEIKSERKSSCRFKNHHLKITVFASSDVLVKLFKCLTNHHFKSL